MKRTSIYELKGKGKLNFLDATFNIGPLLRGGLHLYKPGEKSHAKEERHVHPDHYEVFVNVQGRGTLEIEGREYALTVGGAIVCFIIYLVRSRFPFIPIEPAVIVPGLIVNDWLWINGFIGGAFKFLTLKIGGGKLYFEKGVPLASGFAIGFGVNYFFMNLLNFILYTWPTFLTRL